MMGRKTFGSIRVGYEPFKLGIIQSRGVGDVIIAMPICKWYYDRGHDVHLVVDRQYVNSLSYAFPYVTFHGIYDEEKNLIGNIKNPYWYETPKKILESVGCEKIMSFPYEEVKYANSIGDLIGRIQGEYEKEAVRKNLTKHLGFDQFKYAVAGVPFEEKWNLQLRRNLKREYDLFNEVVKSPNYMVVHSIVNNGTFTIEIEDYTHFNNLYGQDLQIIKLEKITDNLFDWITILENASCFVGVDSSYVNLIDQLGLNIDKYFIQKSDVTFTPVLKGKWEHVRGLG